MYLTDGTALDLSNRESADRSFLAASMLLKSSYAIPPPSVSVIDPNSKPRLLVRKFRQRSVS
jgi:hypothetical protein